MTKNSTQIKALVNDIFLFGDGSFDQFDTGDLFSLLIAADEAYASGQSILNDAQYDALYRYVETSDPGNNYFYGVGSEVRGGKIKLPYTMGSLTQVYEGDTQKWSSQYDLKDLDIVITEKLDGISALIVYDKNGKFQIAYSRGDGIEGADISRHVSKIASLPKQVKGGMIVRAEIIFTKKNWNLVKTQIKRSGGAFYKNARNATAGLMNASESDPIAYKHLSVVAYEIMESKHNKVNVLTELLANDFDVPHYTSRKGSQLTDDVLTGLVNKFREESAYEIDGIVLEVGDTTKRAQMNPSKNTLNPEYARKYKVADASNMAIATVVEVQWNLSKNGYLKPRVKIEPTELVGVTVQHATGFNAAFIFNSGIGPGAKVRITRSGDVIPFIVGVVEAVEPQMPEEEEVTWTKNSKGENVDLVLDNAGDNETVQLEQMIDFFGKVGTEYLGEGNLKTIYESGFTTVVDVINLSQFEWTSMIGANGKKIYKSIREKLKNVPWYIVAGAHSAFGRGVGVRKMKKLYEAFEGDMTKLSSVPAILAVEGFELKTATKITNGFTDFIKFLTDTSATIEFAPYEAPKSGGLTGQTFLFTGFRSSELEAKIVEQGGKISSSVSSKLTYLVAADPSENSGKLKKARDLGTKILSREELEKML